MVVSVAVVLSCSWDDLFAGNMELCDVCIDLVENIGKVEELVGVLFFDTFHG